MSSGASWNSPMPFCTIPTPMTLMTMPTATFFTVGQIDGVNADSWATQSPPMNFPHPTMAQVGGDWQRRGASGLSGASAPTLHSARRFSASFIALKPCFVAANAEPPMISGSKSPEKYSPWVSCVMRGPA